MEIASFHEFSDSLHEAEADGTYGYDWYIITQTPKLNGEPGYVEKWAGSWIDVDRSNGKKVESWFVGQGRVALYYVDSYVLEAFIKPKDQKSDLSKVAIIKVDPVGINEEKIYTSEFGYDIGGTLGINRGAEGNKTTGGVSVSLSSGVNCRESVSFTVRDCNCLTYTGGKDNETRVKWEYTFKKPSGKYQKIEDVAKLSHSTFTPTNIWVWRIPTKYRQQFLTFTSSIQVNVASIITRYSGSQNAKIINSIPAVYSTEFKLPLPPLLCCEKQFLTFDKGGGASDVALRTEYDKLSISALDENNEPCDWVKVTHLQADTEESRLKIKVEPLENPTMDRKCKLIITGDNGGRKKAYQDGKQDLEEIQIVISQSENADGNLEIK